MDRHDLAPILERHVLNLVHNLDARVRQQDVDAPMGIDHPIHADLDGVCVGDVHLNRHMPVAKRSGRLGCLVEVDIGDRTRLGIAPRDLMADAAGAAGHDANLVVESHGAASFLVVRAAVLEPLRRVGNAGTWPRPVLLRVEGCATWCQKRASTAPSASCFWR